MSRLESVSSLLVAAGLELSPTETEDLARAYPKLRAAINVLYDVASHDEEPILVFRCAEDDASLPDTVLMPESSATK